MEFTPLPSRAERRVASVATYLNFDLLVAKQRHEEGDDSGVDDHLDLLVAPVGQIRQSPHCVYKDLSAHTENM